jgi:regulator of sigma E protease
MSRMQDILATATPQDSARLRKTTVVVQRADSEALDTLAMTLTSDYRMGVLQANVFKTYPKVTNHYTFLEAIPAGINHGCEVLGGYVDDLKYLFTKDGAKSMGSFGTIGSLFPASWDWLRFWEMTAFISIILAFMNILPIPALDGGHVFFLLYEIVARRKPSDKFMERAQMFGMSLLMLLMLWAVLNDVIRFVF